jgi:hypothetical protein
MNEPTPKEIRAGADLRPMYDEKGHRLVYSQPYLAPAIAEVLKPGTPGYIVIRKQENRRQRLFRWFLRRKPPVEVWPVKVKS